MAGVAGALCELFHIDLANCTARPKKIGLCLAQTATCRCLAASGEHLRYVCYPELWGQQGGLEGSINCSAAAGRVKAGGAVWVANYNVFRASLSGRGIS